jgi:hypothetical protein
MGALPLLYPPTNKSGFRFAQKKGCVKTEIFLCHSPGQLSMLAGLESVVAKVASSLFFPPPLFTFSPILNQHPN